MMLLKNISHKTHKLILLMLLSLCANNARSQDSTTAVKNIISSIESYHKLYPSEKLFIKLDKPYYTINDTIWFKAFLFNASSFTPAKLSGKLYVELINDSSRVVNRFVIPVKSGLGQGRVVLNGEVTEGTYTLRAYTNWMQNFGSDAFFTKQLYVGKPATAASWLINEQHVVKTGAGGNEVDLNVNLAGLNKLAVAYRDVELKLMEDKSTLFKGSYTTADNGGLHTKFMLPAKADARNLFLVITDKVTKKTFATPFYPGGEMKNIDLQFMPEGGYLVAGLANKIGFKAIGDDGLGQDIRGKILNSKNQEVGNFSSLRNGMGNFWLLPAANESYAASYNINGVMRSAVLPVVRPSGILLKVDNMAHADSVLIHIMATPDVARADKTYSLIAQSADGVYLGVSFNLQNGFSNIRLPKSAFLTGIANFSILDGAVPINERKIFIDHHDRLALNADKNIDNYHPNDSISVKLYVCDVSGKPVKGNFTVSVTDDGYIKGDVYQDDMVSRLLLTSEIKGNIENPAWYFTDNTNTAQALDNVMLTQGWTGFQWAKATNPGLTAKFLPEPDNSLTGKLTNLFNKPVKGVKVSLFAVSKKYGPVIIDTLSDAAGNFKFRELPVLDTIRYTIRASTLKGKDVGANISLNDFKPTGIKLPEPNRQAPWYFNNTDNTAVNYFAAPQPPAKINPADVKGKLLNEVTIKSTKPIKWADYVPALRKTIDEKTLVAAANMNLRDLMSKNFNSFYIGVGSFYSFHPTEKPKNQDVSMYVIGTHALVDFIVDGQSMQEWFGDSVTGMPGSFREAITSFLYTTSAADIKRIRISDGLGPFIVVETRGGKGIFTRTTPGMIVYHPVPYCMPTQFYKPRYMVKVMPGIPRPILHWEPDLVTDANGNATLSFFAADKPSTYTVSIDGADMLGHFGSQILKIKIAGKPVN